MSAEFPKPGHHIDRCECGKVLSQCRCIGPKTERIVSPCRHKAQTYTVVNPASSEETAAANANGFGTPTPKRGRT